MDALAIRPGYSLTNPVASLGRLTQGGWFPVGRTRSGLLCLTRTAVSIAGIGGCTFSVHKQTNRAMFSRSAYAALLSRSGHPGQTVSTWGALWTPGFVPSGAIET
jgi:hypothetical protein